MSANDNIDPPDLPHKPLTSFTFFPRLPQEIRGMVWTLHLDAKPRLVQVLRRTPLPGEIVEIKRKGEWTDEDSKTFRRNEAARVEFAESVIAYMPGGLHVCRESRTIVKKHYTQLTFKVYPLQRIVWFCSSLDTLGIMSEHILNRIIGERIPGITSLALTGYNMSSTDTLEDCEESMIFDVKQATFWFPDIKELHLVQAQDENELPKPLPILRNQLLKNFETVLDRTILRQTARTRSWLEKRYGAVDEVAVEEDAKREYSLCAFIFDARQRPSKDQRIATSICTIRELIKSFE